jgi:UDP-2,3-diacylglucosamine pyrophosphatase LpxH
MQDNSKPIYIVGDVHGRFDLLQQEINRYDIRDCVLICVGDLGIGFHYPTDPNKEFRIIDQTQEWFARRDIRFYSIRGNHDDPQFFMGEKRIVSPNFELLEDYTTLTLNDQKFLLIGGAISVDREATDSRGRRYRTQGISWWKDEVLVLKPELLQECDVLITHTAPTWNGPLDKEGIRGIVNYDIVDPTLWDECVAERRTIDEIIQKTRPKMHYCGHFHQYSWCEGWGCYSTILAIMQIKEHRMIVVD